MRALSFSALQPFDDKKHSHRQYSSDGQTDQTAVDESGQKVYDQTDPGYGHLIPFAPFSAFAFCNWSSLLFASTTFSISSNFMGPFPSSA